MSTWLPVAAAGSGTPQCAVTGWPGQTGQTSPAALSQTVKMKSMCGAPALANSFQFLERRPSVPRLFFRSRSSANGLTAPLGWLPALKARNFPRPAEFRYASARMDLAELPVQRKRTFSAFMLRSIGNSHALTPVQRPPLASPGGLHRCVGAAATRLAFSLFLLVQCA